MATSYVLNFVTVVPHDYIRLVGGDSPSEGRVEILHQGVWGTICHSHWSVNDANVICRELGYARAISFPGYSTFPGGTGQVSKGGPWTG